MDFSHVVAYVPARNEEPYIGKTLEALVKLNVQRKDVFVVDDGSSDDTGRLIAVHGVESKRLPNTNYNKLGRPSLARVHNIALEWARLRRPDAVIIVGADHILPPDYIQQLSTRMNDNTVIASGIARGESLAPENPSGSGRLVTKPFLDLVGWRYPVMWGWEASWIYTAWRHGFETRCYPDVLMESQRPNRAQNRDLPDDVARYYGYAMKQLGYYWPNAVYRSAIFGRKHFSSFIHMLAGYLSPSIPPSPHASWLRTYQFRRLLYATIQNLRRILRCHP